MLPQMLSFSRKGRRLVFLTASPDGRDRSRGSVGHNRRGCLYTREQHLRGGVSRRHQHTRVDAADVQKISSEVFRAGAQSKSVCGHYLLHRSVIVIHAQLSRMIYMCMFFTLHGHHICTKSGRRNNAKTLGDGGAMYLCG